MDRAVAPFCPMSADPSPNPADRPLPPCGHPLLDAQNAMIQEHARRLRQAIAGGGVRAVRRRVIEMITFVLRHALDEEAELELAGCADMAAHERDHDRLGLALGELFAAFVAAGSDAARNAAAVAIGEAIIGHMRDEADSLRAAFASAA